MLNHLVPAGIIAGALGLALFAQSVATPPAELQTRLDINPWGQLAGEFDSCSVTQPVASSPAFRKAGGAGCAPGIAWQERAQPPIDALQLASR